MPTTRLPERLTPLAATANLQAFYGDIHNHCDISYGHGSLTDALQNARSQLDFVSVTGHAYWPDMPVGDKSVAHIVDFHVKGFARLEKLWPGHFEALAAAHEPGAFTVFPGYEMHSSAYGDYTILLRDLEQRTMLKVDSPAGLSAALRAAYGDRAMAFPHHIAYRRGARGINWDAFSEALSPVIEMISMHGCSETSLNDRPFLHSMGPGDGLNTVHSGLNHGHIFGVIGNTDHHSGFPGSYGHGRSVAYAPANTSKDIWNALRTRRTNALTGDNCHLFCMIGEAMQGDIIAPANHAELAVEAVGGSFIDYIDVIRNGAIAHRVTPAVTPDAIDPTQTGLETILAVELGWGARGSFHDWEGSLTVRNGAFLSLEPRLRGPEVVSPLEQTGQAAGSNTLVLDGDRLTFNIRSHANPNNMTPAMQGFALRVLLEPDAVIDATFNGMEMTISAERLMRGALSGNLGAIDTPAFRFHPLPRPRDWQWRGRIALEPLKKGDWLSVRMRQLNGQWAWTSPIFCR